MRSQRVGPRAFLERVGSPRRTPRTDFEVGRQLNQNLMAVGEKHGVDMRVGLRQLGIGGTDAQAAGVAYARASMRETSFGVPSPFRNPMPARSLPDGMTARDLDTARQIVGAVRPHELRSAPSVEFLDNLVQTAFHRRTQLSEDPRRTVEDGTQATDLDRWMRETYNNLPDRGPGGWAAPGSGRIEGRRGQSEGNDPGRGSQPEEERLGHGWDGRLLAGIGGRFVHWTCPRCRTRHSGLLPSRDDRRPRGARDEQPDQEGAER